MMATVFLHLGADDPVEEVLLAVPGHPCVAVRVAWLQLFVAQDSAVTARRVAEALNRAAHQMEATVTPELEAFAAVEGDLG